MSIICPPPCFLWRLFHRLGLAVLGSRKKENICLKVDKALGEMLPDLPDGSPAAEDAIAVAGAKKAARTVITVLMSAYKFPEVTPTTWMVLVFMACFNYPAECCNHCTILFPGDLSPTKWTHFTKGSCYSTYVLQ